MGNDKNRGPNSKRRRLTWDRGVCSPENKRKSAENHHDLGVGEAEKENRKPCDDNASQRKFGGTLMEEERVHGSGSINEGFILMNVYALCTFIDSLGAIKCSTCDKTMSTTIRNEAMGFAHQCVASCQECTSEMPLFWTSPRVVKSEVNSDEVEARRPFEINQRMVCFARDIGKNETCLATFSKELNCPSSLSHSAYTSRSMTICVLLQKLLPWRV